MKKLTTGILIASVVFSVLSPVFQVSANSNLTMKQHIQMAQQEQLKQKKIEAKRKQIDKQINQIKEASSIILRF